MQKLPSLLFCSALPAIVFCFCNSNRSATNPSPSAEWVNDSLPYNLQAPSLVLSLKDPELKEISGLSPTENPGVYLAIADERGAVFFVDLQQDGAVTRRVLFREKGDFEGVEMVGNAIWAAKSNGDMFEISAWEDGSAPSVAEYKTPLKKHNDIEGLAYDHTRNALLLACKENPDSLYPRQIFAFNLKSKTLDPTAVYTINPEEVNRLVPYGEVEKHDYFSPSGLAVHPVTGDIYLISTALKRLVVLDYKTGKIKFARRLDKKILPQPEGISFDQQGNLLLSSEGKQGEGLILKFDFKAK